MRRLLVGYDCTTLKLCGATPSVCFENTFVHDKRVLLGVEVDAETCVGTCVSAVRVISNFPVVYDK